jgi:tripartite-type tricarboxylate transporter receptor subunit TctC
MVHSQLKARMRLSSIVAAVMISVTMAGSALAQGYPTKPITLVVPGAAGIGPDLWARVLADKMSPRLGQPIVVENKPGVGGLLGAAYVAKSGADGHVLLVTTNAMATAPHVLPKGGLVGNLDVLRDLTPISLLGISDTVLIVKKTLGVKSVAELITLAATRPLSCGSTPVGSSLHLACVMFRKAVGHDMTLVPYRGSPQLITDMTAGRLDLMFIGYSSIAANLTPEAPFAPIALASARRSTLSPDLPTMPQLGYPGVVVGSWYGVYGPAVMPTNVVAQLNGLIDAILQTPEVRQIAVQNGLEIVGGPPSQMAQLFESDFARYERVVRDANIKAEE